MIYLYYILVGLLLFFLAFLGRPKNATFIDGILVFFILIFAWPIVVFDIYNHKK